VAGSADGECGSPQETASSAWNLLRPLEEGDSLPELPSQDELFHRRSLSAFSNRRGLPGLRRGSDDMSDICGSEYSGAGVRSAARTMEHCSCSTDTTMSLADMEDIINNKAGFESGEWGSGPNSPRLSPVIARRSETELGVRAAPFILLCGEANASVSGACTGDHSDNSHTIQSATASRIRPSCGNYAGAVKPS
jgi:hypothetical protein